MEQQRTFLAELAAIGCVSAGGIGSYSAGESRALLCSAAFAGTFVLARHRAAAGPAPFQLVLVLLLVVFSFVLHIVYLPAGLCCFFTLMLCKNEVLLPPRNVKTD
jgi:hypothetical protein